MHRWKRKYRGMARRIRKRHPLLSVHPLWLLLITTLAWYYYDLFDLVEGGRSSMAFFVGLQVCYFYLAIFILLPIGFHTSPVWRSVASQVVLLAAAFLLCALAMVVRGIARGTIEVSTDFSEPFHFDIVNFGEMIFLYLGLSPGLATALFYIERFLIKKRKVKRLWLLYHHAMRRVVVAEINWLEWQMQPHLLGNLMTTIRDAARAAKPIKLVRATNYVANLMQFYTQRANSTTAIKLKEEIAQVRALLAIHKLAGTRGGAAAHIRLDIDEAARNRMVLPMALLVLVENMLHHASRIDRRHPARVEITAVPGGTCILAENAHDPHPAAVRHANGNQVALHNISKRLRALHPAATLEHGQSDGTFAVAIFIPNGFVSLPQSN